MSKLTDFIVSADSIIDDTVTATDSTWSSNKINTEIGALVDDTVTTTDSTWSSQKTFDEIKKDKPSTAYLMAFGAI